MTGLSQLTLEPSELRYLYSECWTQSHMYSEHEGMYSEQQIFPNRARRIHTPVVFQHSSVPQMNTSGDISASACGACKHLWYTLDMKTFVE
jgi:hypothetical protein